jgi:hypothetical protein
MFDHVQLFVFDSCRIFFNTGGLGAFGGARRAGAATRQAAASDTAVPAAQIPAAQQYKIEVSADGSEYQTVLDKTNNSVPRYTEFAEIPPTIGRFVRLTITDWPRNASVPLGIVEFTVFGKAVEPETR